MTREELDKEKEAAQERAVSSLLAGGDVKALVAGLWDEAFKWAWKDEALLSQVDEEFAWRDALEIPGLLKDMRVVYQAGGAKAGATAAQKQLGKMFGEDPRGFLEQMQRLEMQHKMAIARKDKLDELVKKGVAKEREKEGKGKEEDLGTAKALELCDKLLDECHAQKGK